MKLKLVWLFVGRFFVIDEIETSLFVIDEIETSLFVIDEIETINATAKTEIATKSSWLDLEQGEPNGKRVGLNLFPLHRIQIVQIQYSQFLRLWPTSKPACFLI